VEFLGLCLGMMGGGALVTGVWTFAARRAHKKQREKFWSKHWKRAREDYIKKNGHGQPGRLIVRNLSADLEVRAIFRPICRHGHGKCHCHHGGSHG